jgi:hypothetical protein
MVNGFGDESNGGEGWVSSARQTRRPACHPTASTPYCLQEPSDGKGSHGCDVGNGCWPGGGSSDDEVTEESVREERGGGREGGFSWRVNTLICTSSYVKHTSSQLVTSNTRQMPGHYHGMPDHQKWHQTKS